MRTSSRPIDPDDVLPELIRFFRADRQRAQRVLAEHVDDGRGRCRMCPLAVQQNLYREWPCTLQLAATAAFAVR